MLQASKKISNLIKYIDAYATSNNYDIAPYFTAMLEKYGPLSYEEIKQLFDYVDISNYSLNHKLAFYVSFMTLGNLKSSDFPYYLRFKELSQKINENYIIKNPKRILSFAGIFIFLIYLLYIMTEKSDLREMSVIFLMFFAFLFIFFNEKSKIFKSCTDKTITTNVFQDIIERNYSTILFLYEECQMAKQNYKPITITLDSIDTTTIKKQNPVSINTNKMIDIVNLMNQIKDEEIKTKLQYLDNLMKNDDSNETIQKLKEIYIPKMIENVQKADAYNLSFITLSKLIDYIITIYSGELEKIQNQRQNEIDIVSDSIIETLKSFGYENTTNKKLNLND